jgi:hypothetical protein
MEFSYYTVASICSSSLPRARKFNVFLLSRREIQDRFPNDIMTVDQDVLLRVWDEIASSLDTCRVTRGQH